MSNATATHTLPPKETAATVRDLINVNLSLSDVLAEESKFMERMQIQKVSEIQERKLRLISLMERYMRYMQQHPHIMAAITVDERRDLQKAGERFRDVSRTNYDKLLVARAVNGAVVTCVTQEIAKASHNPVYNANGNIKRAYRAPISVTLNQTI
jgi:hypothetical protein